MRHEELRHYHLRCTCGYGASSAADLQEHVDAMHRIEEDTCGYNGADGGQCHRPAIAGWSTCRRHYSAGHRQRGE